MPLLSKIKFKEFVEHPKEGLLIIALAVIGYLWLQNNTMLKNEAEHCKHENIEQSKQIKKLQRDYFEVVAKLELLTDEEN